MILVVGATGFLGTEISRRLRSKGVPVRGLVRRTSNPQAVDRLRGIGVEIAEGDLKEAASLVPVCEGVRGVISTATTTHSRQAGDSIESTDEAGQRNLVEAARHAGAGQFTYISYSGGIDTDDPLTRAKRAVEWQLQQSGMRYTILRPSFFMDVWLSPALGFDYPNAKATIFGDGTHGVSWIALHDVAAFVAETLDHPSAQNAILELGGPEPVSPLEAVRIFEEVGGRQFDVQHVPQAELETQFASAPDSLQQTFAALRLNYAKGDAIPMERILREFPVPLTSVRDYARRVVAAQPPRA